jgi:aspartyl-tRNA(Asn)/glutamyl-tRNA(Gln) amidotransferase subunit C
MNITEKDVAYVAALAHLDLTAEEQKRMQRDLDSILGFIDSLNELDTKDVPPMAQVESMSAAAESSATSTLRADVQIPCLSHDAALKNSPQPDKIFFKVPKVIER